MNNSKEIKYKKKLYGYYMKIKNGFKNIFKTKIPENIDII
jgi:hypothetical protein